MRFLIIFVFLITNSLAEESIGIKNLIINKDLKKYEDLRFIDDQNNQIYLDDFNGNLILLNFWATWCAPCKKEMPSLNRLKQNKNLDNLRIFPINIGKDNLKKSLKFFEDLEIKNLNIYFDNPKTLAKKLSLRGVPTTILINKNGYEFARIMGSINFDDQNFIKWLSNFN